MRWHGQRPALSQVLPIFDQLSLPLVDHRPEPAADTFVFSRLDDPLADEVLALLTEAFVMAWEGSVDRDVFASLVVAAELSARQVQLVRAVNEYLQQAGLGASRPYVRRILSTHRDFVRHWVEAFEARFDPNGPDPGEHHLAEQADAAATRDEIRVLHWYAGLLDGSRGRRTSAATAAGPRRRSS